MTKKEVSSCKYFKRLADGIRKIFWDGYIGKVDVSKIPGQYGTSTFGNAIEGDVIELVGKSTGQQFLPKNPSANGPDLYLPPPK